MDPTSAASRAVALPGTAAFCLAMMHSLCASSGEAISECVCVLCMGAMLSGGHERVYVMSLGSLLSTPVAGPAQPSVAGELGRAQVPHPLRGDEDGKGDEDRAS